MARSRSGGLAGADAQENVSCPPWRNAEKEGDGDGEKGVDLNLTESESARANMKHKTSQSHLSTVISVSGSVVDVRFGAHVPPFYPVKEMARRGAEYLSRLPL
jgi:hypothetical protein